MRTVLIWALALGCAAVACDKPRSDPAPPISSATTSAAANTATDTAAPPKASPVETDASGKTQRSYETDTYRVTVLADSCKAKSACTATLELVAKAGYHVNKDFPAKFTAKSAPGVAFKGKDKPEEFSKSAGDFELGSPEKASMKVRYEADGSAKLVPLSGKFKLSVCSDASCQMADPELDVPVPLSS